MKVYEYVCRECGKTHMLREWGHEDTPCLHEGCQGTLRRIYSGEFFWPQAQRGH